MKLPNFNYEAKLWKKGYGFIAGCDEVGRGCFAGPVVAGVVVFPKNLEIDKEIVINDSKQVKPRNREKASSWIKKNALTWGIGEIPVSIINRLGMGKATQMAFRQAIHEANNRLNGSKIDYLLIDAFYIPFTKGLRRKNQKPIIKGDTKSLSIAAASIIAKVYRDKLMLKLSKKPKFRKYGWGRNKGYGTRQHQNAIKKHGISRYHRKSFVATFLSH